MPVHESSCLKPGAERQNLYGHACVSSNAPDIPCITLPYGRNEDMYASSSCNQTFDDARQRLGVQPVNHSFMILS